MRRISIVTAVVFSTLLFLGTGSAQQTNDTAPNVGPPTVVNCTNAQNGRVAIFTQVLPPNVVLCNSGIYEAQPYGSGAVGILNPNPVAALDVNGNINTSLYYQIGGSNVLSNPGGATNTAVGIGVLQNNGGAHNTAVGYTSLQASTTGSDNTAEGYQALLFNTSGGGSTAVGSYALESNSTGNYNTGVGTEALTANISGSYNVALGLAMYANTSGSYNVAIGGGALYVSRASSESVAIGASALNSLQNGDDNTAVGAGALELLTSGEGNVAFGFGTLSSITSGSGNLALGVNAGDNLTTGSNNVDIASEGTSNDSNIIRLGTVGTHTQTFIAGIYGVNVSGVPVQINSNGQLGTQGSSLRFKEQVRDMGDSTDALMKLRPVTFFYRPEYDNGKRTLQYGLIAEEVAKVYPELVAYDNDGQPYSVRYQYLSAMLLNEVQKQYHGAEAEAKVIENQQDEIESLRKQNQEFQERLSRLESLVSAQAQTLAQK